MPINSNEPRRSTLAQSTALAFVAILAAFAVSACGAEPSEHDEEIVTETSQAATTVSTRSAITTAVCNAFVPQSGTANICHKTATKYVVTKVTRTQCYSHGGHPDYPAVFDPTCTGNVCMPANLPCGTNLKCCSGLTCNAGKCGVPACLPSLAPCSVADAGKCCSQTCICPTSGIPGGGACGCGVSAP